jgi:hypothetical protein
VRLPNTLFWPLEAKFLKKLSAPRCAFIFGSWIANNKKKWWGMNEE